MEIKIMHFDDVNGDLFSNYDILVDALFGTINQFILIER